MSSSKAKLQDTIAAFSGELEVQDGTFILDADRLVIRDGVIAFTLSGSDDDGEFKVDGNANLTSSGKYVSNKLKVHYSRFIGKDDATIQFDVIMPTAKKLRCRVEGRWVRGIEVWPFSGNLHPFKPE